MRISTPEILSAWLVPAAIDAMSRRHPQISVRVFQQDANILEFRALYDRNVDLVINRLPMNFAHDDLHTEVLLDDSHFVVTGTQSRWARRRKVTLAELADEPWMFPPNPVVNSVLREAFEAEGLKVPMGRVAADSVLLRLHLVATGRYLSVLPESVLRSVLAQMSLKVLPIKLRMKSPPIVIVRLKNRTLSPVVQLFIDHLREVTKSKSPTVRDRKS